ncbi:response regulator [Leptospira langatensis]|uniref:Response regulator n=1 Tax=Leptospira langatensis TaxID=2484983 RepID=A0A5F1ZXD5_9LEPT|nr:response regulator [Leptospira langatensis]TGJ98419.1 response regulator [Leptospira langatensis]TGL43334.1 response regulator [Leptospira langatensis]
MITDQAKILIVEDENIVAKDIFNRLAGLGYSAIAIAATGNEALEKAILDKPDIILMDIMLSRGDYDGIETVQELADKADIPVIYLTAYADEASLIRSKTTRPYGYLLKPFQTKELQISIEIALNKHKMEKKRKSSRKLLSTVMKYVKDVIETSSKKVGA